MAQPTLRKTPGVYIEEIALFPPSVAPVETAIPAFIGYTEKAKKRDQDLTNVPTRITSLLEYEQYFGKAKTEAFEFDVNLNLDKTFSITSVSIPTIKFSMYYAMQMFFANGGGPCYIISVGNFEDEITMGALEKGLRENAKIDETTIIVFPDAYKLNDLSNYTSLMNSSIDQCQKLQDRVAIIDIPSIINEYDEDAIKEFRTKIHSDINKIKYGAVYYPCLETVLNISYSDSSVNIRYFSENAQSEYDKFLATGKTSLETAAELIFVTKIKDLFDALGANPTDDKIKTFNEELNTESKNAKRTIPKTLSDILVVDPFDNAKFKTEIEKLVTEVTKKKSDAESAATIAKTKFEEKASGDKRGKAIGNKLYKEDHSLIYNTIKNKIQTEFRVTLPPSSTVAGIYADVDRTRGVWKAPANVSLNFVIRPIVKITDDIQDGLNVHPEGGKSINAIRSFTGRGTLVWGARTLAGNDNEWRYISVRRFFNFVEESVKKASARFVFEPNSKNTWVKVKAMIENFLIVQWRAGALVGDKPEHAFYVKVGLNETMTAEDILNGYMVVEIGMAVVRPAEFIILQFSHKMQES